MWTEHGSGLLTFRLSAAIGVSIHHCFANHVYICLVSFRPYVIEVLQYQLSLFFLFIGIYNNKLIISKLNQLLHIPQLITP
jgi:hypothetical protein